MAASGGTPLLVAPLFGYTKDGVLPYKPTVREVIAEWIDSTNFFRDRTRALIALNFLYYCFTGVLFVIFLAYHLSLAAILFFVVALCFVGTVYNTVWYHRYCSHAAFTFSQPYYTSLFLWTTPLVFRESTYAIPHRVHHQNSEKPGDPYGPHLGWLGNYLAIESSMKLNTSVTERQYELMVKSITHIGFKINSYSEFQKTGSVEQVGFYLSKTLFAQLFWLSLTFWSGGIAYVMAWYSAVFVATSLIRDFNWRGHGGNGGRAKELGWEFDDKSHALNQYFYGYIASEWHDNHHKYPFSANNGFLSGQIDVAFHIIQLMHRIGIVESYVDARPTFEKECLASSADSTPPLSTGACK